MYQTSFQKPGPAGPCTSGFAVKFSVFFTVFIFIIALSGGTAWSFERFDVSVLPGASPSFSAQGPDRRDSSFSGTEQCLLLLEASVHSPQAVSVTEESRHSAGSAAPLALGLVFGVRYALAPPKSHTAKRDHARFDVWQTLPSSGSRHALAVADYRSCQKEKALRAFHNFGWVR